MDRRQIFGLEVKDSEAFTSINESRMTCFWKPFLSLFCHLTVLWFARRVLHIALAWGVGMNAYAWDRRTLFSCVWKKRNRENNRVFLVYCFTLVFILWGVKYVWWLYVVLVKWSEAVDEIVEFCIYERPRRCSGDSIEYVRFDYSVATIYYLFYRVS